MLRITSQYVTVDIIPSFSLMLGCLQMQNRQVRILVEAMLTYVCSMMLTIKNKLEFKIKIYTRPDKYIPSTLSAPIAVFHYT